MAGIGYLAGSSQVQAGPIVFDVGSSIAPNIVSSPPASFYGWNANAQSAMQSGPGGVFGSAGSPGTPSYYTNVGAISPNQIIVSGFPSWNGQTNPGSTFGPAFANEYGNRLHFPVHIHSDPSNKFSLSELNAKMTSTDPGNFFNIPAFNYSGFVYDAEHVGYDSVTNTYYKSGEAGNTLVTDLFFRGIGNAFEAVQGPGQSPQDALNDAANFGGSISPFDITAQYWIDRGSGGFFSGSGTVTVIPEPTSIAVFGMMAVAGAYYGLRRRRHTKLLIMCPFVGPCPKAGPA